MRLGRILGAPLTKQERQLWEKSILARFPEHIESAVDYAYKTIDRQINKSRGLLTFNAILFAGFRGFRGFRGSSVDPSGLVTAGTMLALLGCVPLLALLWVTWGDEADWKSGGADFKLAANAIYRRTYMLSVSLTLSGFATVIAIAEVVKAG